MANIEEAGRISIQFLRNTVNAKDIKVVRTTRVQDGWEAKVEVYEESAFIKALGLPTRVMDRNLYVVKLDDQLEVQSFERQTGDK